MRRLSEIVQTTMASVSDLVRTPRYVVGGVVGLLGAGFSVRSLIYRRVAEESAELGKAVLDKNVDNLTHTLKAVARDEETVDALVQLLVELLAAETTRKALIALLIDAFKDEGLTHETGVFALNALDTEDARRMLDVQLARLVSTTVLDEQVHRDTAIGIRCAMKRALLGRTKK